MNTVDSSKLADTAQKMKFFSKYTKEIRNGKLHFLCSEPALSRLVFLCKLWCKKHNFAINAI